MTTYDTLGIVLLTLMGSVLGGCFIGYPLGFKKGFRHGSRNAFRQSQEVIKKYLRVLPDSSDHMKTVKAVEQAQQKYTQK